MLFETKRRADCLSKRRRTRVAFEWFTELSQTLNLMGCSSIQITFFTEAHFQECNFYNFLFYFYLISSFLKVFMYSYHRLSLSLHSLVMRNHPKMYSTVNFKTHYSSIHLPYTDGKWIKPFVCVAPCSSVRLKSGIVENEITFPRKVYFVKYQDIHITRESVVKVIVITVFFMVLLKIQMFQPSCIRKYLSVALVSMATLQDFIHGFKD